MWINNGKIKKEYIYIRPMRVKDCHLPFPEINVRPDLISQSLRPTLPMLSLPTPIVSLPGVLYGNPWDNNSIEMILQSLNVLDEEDYDIYDGKMMLLVEEDYGPPSYQEDEILTSYEFSRLNFLEEKSNFEYEEELTEYHVLGMLYARSPLFTIPRPSAPVLDEFDEPDHRRLPARESPTNGNSIAGGSNGDATSSINPNEISNLLSALARQNIAGGRKSGRKKKSVGAHNKRRAF